MQVKEEDTQEKCGVDKGGGGSWRWHMMQAQGVDFASYHRWQRFYKLQHASLNMS